MASSTPLLASAKFELEYNQGSVYGDDDRAAVLRVLDANAPSCGKEVLAFEKEFAEFSGVSHAIAVGNGSQALELAYRAVLKLTQCTAVRKEVIVPAVSWMATAGAAILAGINTVKFADVVDPTVCVDIEAIKRLVSPNTIAVTVVHLFGRPVDGVEELAEWLKSRNIYLIEDCAHAVGSVTSTGAACGTIGDIGIFSFQQQKNMVTLGEGGMCTTNNPAVRELIVGYRSVCAMSYDPKGKYLALDQMKHPMGHRYWMVDFLDHGHNFRMIDMQAAVGRVQLRRVREWNLRRADIARMIATGLSDISSILRLPDVSNSGSSVHSWHVFHVLVTDAFPLPKEDFMWSMLNEFGIKVWNHYSPMHLATSFRSQGMGSLGDCPVAEALFEQYVSLPIHARLTDAAVLYMIDAIKQLASRTPIVRLAKAPLLNELLKLSEPLSSNNADGNDQAILQQQWSLFEPMVGAAVLDGLFATREANSAISVTRSPGRLDLMGGNDDYTGGLVFECTIAEGTYVAAQAVGTELVLRNRQLSEIDIFIPLDIICRSNLTASKLAAAVMDRFPSKRWLLYVVGVLFWLYKRFPDKMFRHGQQGLSLLIWSQVPLNRGVSSSASVEVAIMKAAAHAFGISMEGELLATACQWAENEVCSSACGLMDQMAVTLGGPFMAMRCQPAVICRAPPLPEDLTVFAVDSGVSHEVSGIEYEAARVAAFMGYKMICDAEGLEVIEDCSGEITRYTDAKYNGYLANMMPSVFMRKFEKMLPMEITGREYLDRCGIHVDPATSVIADHVYHVRANTKYAVLENNRVNLFYNLLHGCSADYGSPRHDLYCQLGDLMYQSHDAYTECGLGSVATSKIVELVQSLGSNNGLFGAKITGGGAGGTVAVLGLKTAEAAFKEVVTAYAAQSGFSEAPYVFVGSSPGADAFGVRQI